jgi:hypothetical protein
MPGSLPTLLTYFERSARLNDRHSHPKLGASDKSRSSSWIELYYGEVYRGLRAMSRNEPTHGAYLVDHNEWHCRRLPIKILYVWGE